MSTANPLGKYQPYPEYKDSGVEWLGEIPDAWELWKLAHAYDVIGSGTTPPTNEDKWFGDGVPWVTTGELREAVVEQTTKNVTFEALNQFSALKIHPAGSVVIAMYGATIGRLGVLGIDATTNQACCVLTQSQHLYNQYVFYWLHAFRDEIIKLSSGGGQPNINQEKVASLKITAPDYSHQKTIVSFLDYETARIDQLIAKQQQLIELLKEKRQAVISHAVTKGLNPNAPMKDSGVEWLGQVPEHWDVRTINQSTQKITNGYVGPTRDILVDSGVPYVQATHIKNGKINFDDEYFVRDEWSKKHKKSILKDGDVLIVQTGAGTGDVGLVSASEHGYNCHALIILQSINNVISGNFLAMVLRSDYGQSVLYSIRTGGMHPHLNCSEVKFVKIPVPAIDEQLEITSYVSNVESKFSILICGANKLISLFRERRTALISAAVTGKIDLRGWQAPQAAPAK